eukprot:1756148-Pyramimonas_sp.AAC.1
MQEGEEEQETTEAKEGAAKSIDWPCLLSKLRLGRSRAWNRWSRASVVPGFSGLFSPRAKDTPAPSDER